MKVILSPRAEKQLKQLPKIDQIAIGQKIRSIRDKTVIDGKEKLRGFARIFKVRVGSYRMVYQKTSQEIYIVLIHHRKDVYRLLKRLFS